MGPIRGCFQPLREFPKEKQAPPPLLQVTNFDILDAVQLVNIGNVERDLNSKSIKAP